MWLSVSAAFRPSLAGLITGVSRVYFGRSAMIVEGVIGARRGVDCHGVLLKDSYLLVGGLYVFGGLSRLVWIDIAIFDRHGGEVVAFA